MKATTIIGAALCSLMLAAYAPAQTTETPKQLKKSVVSMQQASDVYVCPMHSDVTATAAGKCSKCGMALEKRSRAGDAVQSTGHKKEMKKRADKKGCCAGGCESGCEKN